ncbi:MAG: 2-oxoglutarate dehydrogenase E1 component [Candidatus Symbiodolus clandestinus]
MHNQPLRQASPLSGNNQAYLEQYLEVYLTDRQQLEASWQQLFDRLFTESQPFPAGDPLPSSAHSYALSQTKQSNLVGMNYSFPQLLPLIQAFRSEGHRQAQLDPLNRYPIQPWPALQLGFYSQLTDPTAIVEIEPLQALQPIRTLNKLYAWLQQIYCGTIGVEYMHLSDGEQRAWLQKRFEATPVSPLMNSESRAWLHQQLTAAEGLERYLAAQFPGAKRFSLEGSEVTIPLLNYLIQLANQQAMERVVLGMAHRGRLNVLVNVMGKPPRDLFAAFAGTMDDHQMGSGDVKYHQGFYSTLTTDKGPLALSLLFNPSHLEIINPVVMGATRAHQDQQADLQSKRVLAITLHGDSAFAGQGVVQETFNYSQLPGYSVGGSIRIIINNQLGFTTGESQARSSYYCSDIAKSIEAPIFHVNGDDPEAVLRVAQMAFEFRNTFERDVVIDLVSYRRHGHNEADEPSATQPLLYHRIKQQPTIRSRYAQRLIEAAELNAQEAEQQVKQMRQRLQQGDPLVATSAKVCTTQVNIETPEAAVDTRCKLQTLQQLGRQLAQYPEGMLLHPRVAKIYQDRIRMIEGQQPFDWGGAEMLAYASLLAQKIPVRLSGQDSGRGTFFHRHAVLHHQQQGQRYIPLAHLHPDQGRFQIWDSTLSEAAVLAFEYGYALMTPKALVIWEAQFGDFANGAQVVFDQFISASEQKWGERCGITLLLPHGYEGQGPEHSSARLERHLQLCAEQNIQVCLPSHAGQIYHLLRQQGLKSDARPLIILSPKSLLRHSLATARLVELAEGAWQPVIIDFVHPKQTIKRIIFCSGKVYYDLLEKCQNQSNQQILLVRVEQLYPFPQQQIHQLLEQHKQLRSVIWCQEEPRNQGAWSFMQAHLAPLIAQINPKLTLQYVGRSEAAAPAVGALSCHQQQQQQLVAMALNDSDH